MAVYWVEMSGIDGSGGIEKNLGVSNKERGSSDAAPECRFSLIMHKLFVHMKAAGVGSGVIPLTLI